MKKRKVAFDKKLRADLLAITLMPERAYRANAAHIARHFVEDPTKGSKFARGMTMEQVIELTMWCLRGVGAELLVNRLPEETQRLPDGHLQLRWHTPFRLGTCGIVPLIEVPRGVRVMRALRGKGEDAVEVNVVRMQAFPTNALVMSFAKDRRGAWHLFTAYPGLLAPPLTDRAYWDRHAFIDPP